MMALALHLGLRCGVGSRLRERRTHVPRSLTKAVERFVACAGAERAELPGPARFLQQRRTLRDGASRRLHELELHGQRAGGCGCGEHG